MFYKYTDIKIFNTKSQFTEIRNVKKSLLIRVILSWRYTPSYEHGVYNNHGRIKLKLQLVVK